MDEMLENTGVEGNRVCRIAQLEEFREKWWDLQCKQLSIQDIEVNRKMVGDMNSHQGDDRR